MKSKFAFKRERVHAKSTQTAPPPPRNEESSQGFTRQRGILTGTPIGREVDLVEQAMLPLALADTSPVSITPTGPAGQMTAPMSPVLDIGQVLDYSIIAYLRDTKVQVPATLLLHFATAFSVPRLMRNSETYGAARSILLHATLATLTGTTPTESQLLTLAEMAQSLGLSVSPTQMMETLTTKGSELVSRRALPSLIEFMINGDDKTDEFDLIRDLPPFSMSSFSTSLTELSMLLKDTHDQKPLEALLLRCTSLTKADSVLAVIHSLIRVREGYQMTSIPSSLGYAMDNTSIDLPGIKRWEGMDRTSEDNETIAGQFHFFISEQMFSNKITIVDVSKTLAYLDDLIVNLPALDLDLTSLIETVVRTGAGRAFNVKPNFGTVKGRNLLQADEGTFAIDDPISTGMNSLLSAMCLALVFDNTRVAPVLSRIKGYIQAYKPGPETTPFALSLENHAEAYAIAYTAVCSMRRMLEEILDSHTMFTKRFDDLDLPGTTAVLDSTAITLYLDMRDAGFEPYFNTPVPPDSPQSLTSPAELANVAVPFPILYPREVHVTQEPWFNIDVNEQGEAIISLDEAPVPRFIDGRPVHVSSYPMTAGPIAPLGNLIGRTLEHRTDAIWNIPYGDLGAPVDFSQFISLVPTQAFLDALKKRRGNDTIIQVISDIIAERNPKVVDLSISVASNSFILRSRALARTISGSETLMTAAARLYTRFAGTDPTDEVEVDPIIIGNYSGYAYVMGANPTVIFPHFSLFMENTKQGMSSLDWYSIQVPYAVARSASATIAQIYDVDSLFKKPTIPGEMKEVLDPNKKKTGKEGDDPDPDKTDAPPITPDKTEDDAVE